MWENLGFYQRLSHALAWLWVNPLALSGTILSSIGGSSFCAVLLVDLSTNRTNHYASAFGYLVAPGILVLGLLVLAAGMWTGRKRRRQEKAADAGSTDVALRHLRRSHGLLWLLVLGTVFNFVVIAAATLRGAVYTNSTAFCGEACHSVMGPEYGAWKRSPHANVKCVECHVDEGAIHVVDSKVTGMRRVWALATGTVKRPVPTPLDQPPPTRTCEKCHWPKKFHGPRLLVRNTYSNDEKNSRVTSVVLLDVGGFDRRHIKYKGIHWHVAPNVQITYEALDKQRTHIGKVTVKRGGETTVFLAPKMERNKPVAAVVHMNCLDCHTRPSHAFDPTPEAAVDDALSFGKIDPSLPYVRREATKLLRTKGLARPKAAPTFAKALGAFYDAKYPTVAKQKARKIEQAALELAWIYRRNNYPRMHITWGTYRNNVGHSKDNAAVTWGCFRCHDDVHATKSGEVIAQNCDGMCHELLADEEAKPEVSAEVLKLGTM